MHRTLPYYFFVFTHLSLFSMPKDAEILRGDITMKLSENVLEINAQGKAIINWKSFDISPNEIVLFEQSYRNAAILNQVTNGSVTELLGTLKANCPIYLVNSKGVFISSLAQIETAGFIASTADISNEAFWRNDECIFEQLGDGEIVNFGKIETKMGDVLLLARFIENHGEINAPEGNVSFRTSEMMIHPNTKASFFIRLNEDKGIYNEGSIEALSIDFYTDSPYEKAINHIGSISALGSRKENGRIYLTAKKGTAFVNGSLKAEGGQIHVLGEQVILDENAFIDTSAKQGGGTILIGGDYHGNNPDILNSQNTYAAKGAIIKADGLSSGNGGQVIYWSDGITTVCSETSARGGFEGGDGGLIEVSGKKNFFYRGVNDQRAPNGKSGTILFDPESNVTIATGTDTNINGASPFAPTADTANLTPTTLEAALGSGDVILTTSNPTGTQAGNLIFANDVTWSDASFTCSVGNDATINSGVTITNSGTGTFEIDAMRSITVGDTGVVQNTGTGNIVFNANLEGMESGNFSGITIAGNVTTNTGTITFNGTGGSTGSNNDGILINSTGLVSSTFGNIDLTGNAGNNSYGVHLASGTISTTMGGDITINTPDRVQMDLSTMINAAGGITIQNEIMTPCSGLNLLSRASITSGGNFNLYFGNSGLSLIANQLLAIDTFITADNINLQGTGPITLNNTTHLANVYISATDTLTLNTSGNVSLDLIPSTSGIVGAKGTYLFGNDANITARNLTAHIRATDTSDDGTYIQAFNMLTMHITNDLLVHSEGPECFILADIAEIQIDGDCTVLAVGRGSSFEPVASIQCTSSSNFNVDGDFSVLARVAGFEDVGTAASYLELFGNANLNVGGNLLIAPGETNRASETECGFETDVLNATIGGDFIFRSGFPSTGGFVFDSNAFFSGSSEVTVSCSNFIIDSGLGYTQDFPSTSYVDFFSSTYALSCENIIFTVGSVGANNGNTSIPIFFSCDDLIANVSQDVNLSIAALQNMDDAFIDWDIENTNMTIGGDFIIDASNMLSNTNNSANGYMSLVNTNASFDIGGNLSLLGSSQASGNFNADQYVVLSSTGDLTINANNITLTGAINSGTTISTVSIQSINNDIILDCNRLDLSGGTNSTANRSDCFIQAAGNVDIDARGNISIAGGGTNQDTYIQSNTGNIRAFTSRDLNLIGGYGSNADSLIRVTNVGDITIHAVNLNVQGSSSTGNTGVTTPVGDIYVQCANDCNYAAPLSTGPAFMQTFGSDLTVVAGGSINLSGFTTFLTPDPGNLLLIAGQNISIGSSVTVEALGTASDSSLTLVVDNDYPAYPGIGPGQFIILPGSTVSTGTPVTVPLKIYTAIRSQNTIGETINGSTFVPGPEFFNSPTEQWFTYFSGGIYENVPFKIYYKNIPSLNSFYSTVKANLSQLADLLPILKGMRGKNLPNYHFQLCVARIEKHWKRFRNQPPLKYRSQFCTDNVKVNCLDCAPTFSPYGSFIFEDDVYWIGTDF